MGKTPKVGTDKKVHEQQDRKRGPLPNAKLPLVTLNNEYATVTRISYSTNEVQYTVVFNNTLIKRVVCPVCTKLQLDVVNQISNGSFERKCDRCGTKTRYTFNVFRDGVHY